MKLPPPQTAEESAFWGNTHNDVVRQIIERDPGGCHEALASRTAVAWLLRSLESADASSFNGVHRFAVLTVITTLRQIAENDPRVIALYDHWARAQQIAAEALRLASRR